MTITRHLLAVTLIATLAVAATLDTALAQGGAPADVPEATASAPASRSPLTPNGPRLRSPAETGDRATAPGDLRPERPVTPQINIPLGKRPTPASGAPPERRFERVAPRADTAASGGIDDAAARCESEIDTQLRADCRARRARESGTRPSR